MQDETLRTGEVAARAGVNIQTLRYYERRGLLPEPVRRPSGFREYRPEAVRLVRFVKRAQELGFTLSEIEDLLRLRTDRKTACSEVRARAAAKIEDVERRIKSLQAMKRALTVLVASCRSEQTPRECPILEALDTDLKRPDRRRKAAKEDSWQAQ